MTRRLGLWLVGSAALSVGALSGCYQHHTADEEALEIEYPAKYYDGGATVVDAGRGCNQADLIQAFLCGLSGGGTTRPGATPAQPSLTDLLGGGDLAGLLDLFGTLTGGTGGTGAPAGGGGLADILGLLGLDVPGTMGNAPPTTAQPTLQDILAGLGIPARPTTPTTPTMPTTPTNPFAPPTAEQCKNPTSPLVQFACTLQNNMPRRDGGVAPTPAEVDAGATTPVEPAVDAGAPAPVEPVDAGAPAPVEPVDAGAPAPEPVPPVVDPVPPTDPGTLI